MPAIRPRFSVPWRLAALASALLFAGLLTGCKSKSAPTKPVPDPAPTQGQIVLLENDSRFTASVGAGFDCRKSEVIEPAPGDFDPISILFDLSCSAEAQGEGHSGNMAVVGAVGYDHLAPGGGLSKIRFAARAEGNRSPTGLSSCGAVNRLQLRFEVQGAPVPYRAVGSIEYADHFGDFMTLKPVGGPAGTELFSRHGYADGSAGSEMLDVSGTLDPGTYELWVVLDTHDWFTEEVQFALEFTTVVLAAR